MKKMFLDELPKKEGFGANKGKMLIDWRNSVGHKVPFVYYEIEGEIEIIEYIPSNKPKLIVKYKDKIFNNRPISTTSMQRCAIGYYLEKMTSEFKVEINQVFKDEKRDLIITGREYRLDKNNNQNKKWYKYTCNVCSWTEGWIVENSLNKGKGCSCCNGKTAVLGINTIWDTDRWMCDLGVSEEDAKKYTKASSKKIVVICPDCGREKHNKISDIYYYKSIGCTCGDGFSYPEKFMYSILKQLNVEFETQYSPDYLGRRLSDFYLPYYNLVIETDGSLGHEGGTTHSKSSKTLEEYISIDKWKDEQHKLHGIETIRIDCFESDVEYIKGSILNSKLINKFDLTKIDFVQADLYAIKNNKIKEVCEYWNNNAEWETTQTTASIFNTSKTTIRDYLKKGTKLGWCYYNAKQEYMNVLDKNHELRRKSVRCLEDGKVFESVAKAGEYYNTNASSISAVCSGRRKAAKGRTFEHVQ